MQDLAAFLAHIAPPTPTLILCQMALMASLAAKEAMGARLQVARGRAVLIARVVAGADGRLERLPIEAQRATA